MDGNAAAEGGELMEYFGDNFEEGSRINEDAHDIKRRTFYRTVRRRKSLPISSDLGALVSCARYACRLSLAACTRRYAEAQKPMPKQGAIVSERAQYTACRGCEQGKGRSDAS